MKNTTLLAYAAVAAMATTGLVAQTAKPTPAKVPIMAVSGCLKQEGANWFVTTATDPIASSAAADTAPPAGPTTGKGKVQLVGLGEFNLPAIKDHAVTAKGLFVKAAPVSRLNLTSLKSLGPACPAAK